MQQASTLIHATQVIEQLGIPVGSHKGSLRDVLALYGLTPVYQTRNGLGKPAYLYDQAAVSAALPAVKQRIKEIKAEKHRQAVARGNHMRAQLERYKRWCTQIAAARTQPEIDAVVAQIRGELALRAAA
jgi:hypothetical protein